MTEPGEGGAQPQNPTMTGGVALDENALRAELSLAYVLVVAARAGFACEITRVDRDSVDVSIRGKGLMDPTSKLASPMIDLQLKASSSIDPGAESFEFTLKMKNYNDLRVRTQTPRFLVVLELPRDSEQWASIGAEELVLRRCCSWKSLLGSPASTNSVNIKIHMDRAKRFDVEQLRRLMLLASRAEQVTHAD